MTSKNKVLFITTILCLIIIGGVVLPFKKLSLTEKIDSSGLSEISEISINQGTKSQIINDLQEIYKGNITDDQEVSGVPIFSATYPDLFIGIDSITLTLSIDVFKYTRNMRIEEGYEGVHWTRNIGEEVNQLLSLNQGTQIMTDLSLSNGNGIAYTTFLNPGRYSYSDGYFPPARSYVRTFKVVDQDNSQLIQITASLQNNVAEGITITGKNVCYEKLCADITIYQGMSQNMLEEFEHIIKDNLPGVI